MTTPAWGDWAWENREKISRGITALWRWLWPGRKKDQEQESSEEKPGILVLGPGGVGKSTLGRILSGKFDLLFDLLGAYDESIDVESYALKDAPGVEILVPPGQPHRREATWGTELEKLAAGKYRGMILLASYGYHNHEIGPLTSYKNHRLYQGNKEEFLQAFLQDRRREELRVLRDIAPKVTPPAGGKFWLLTLVTKQDLWWEDRAEAERFYMGGEYADEVAKIKHHHGGRLFRDEVVLASLVISNFETGKGESLKPNAAGYDHKHHVQTLRNLLDTLEALRRWEEGP